MAIAGEAEVTGLALVDQVKSLDGKARRAEYKARACDAVVVEALGKARALLIKVEA